MAPLKEAGHIIQPIAEVQADFDEVVVLALHLHQVRGTCGSDSCVTLLSKLQGSGRDCTTCAVTLNICLDFEAE